MLEIQLEVATAYQVLKENLAIENVQPAQRALVLLDKAHRDVMMTKESLASLHNFFLALNLADANSHLDQIEQTLMAMRVLMVQQRQATSDGREESRLRKYAELHARFLAGAGFWKKEFEKELVRMDQMIFRVQLAVTGIALFMVGLMLAVICHFERRRGDSAAEFRRMPDGSSALAADSGRTFQGIISICGYCKKIRDGQGDWSQLEEYLNSCLDAQFSHGICPDCYHKQLGSMNDRQRDGRILRDKGKKNLSIGS